MSVKSELRKELKLKRKLIHSLQTDNKICENLICSDMYIHAKQILFYAALDDEINVDSCVNNALSLGKKVAFPRCSDDKGNMKFYYINSLNDLEEGFFGVREPNENACQVTDFSDTVCIVPAISYDLLGYRLGYGKGYYDRFLQNCSLISVGLCYNKLISDKIPADKHDVPVNYIITESGVSTVG